MRIAVVASVAVVAFLTVAPIRAQREPDTSNSDPSAGESWFDRFAPRGSAWSGFSLFNGCRRIRASLGVQVDEDSSSDYGVTWSRVWNLMESRLRAARLYAELEDSPEEVLAVD